MKAIITQISRILVGGLFIFSGLIKLNDPMGMAFKLEDYFAPDVLNLGFLLPFTLALALIVVIAEVILGVGLLMGWKTKLTIRLLMALIVFFTFLTFYSAYFNKVTDCGCFGDAIPLTPWQSFSKDIILLILILWIWKFEDFIKPLSSPAITNMVVSLALLFCSWMGWHVLRHLPFKDFRPYAIGKNISDGMKPAEDLGLEPPKYLTFYIMTNENTGEEITVDSDTYVKERWWEKSEWSIDGDRTTTKQISKGYEPPIHDFDLILDGEDITEEVLSMDRVILVVCYDLRKSIARLHPLVNDFVNEAEALGIPTVGLTATDPATVEELRHEWQMPYPFAAADQTTLKTIIRANPGVVVLNKGTVVAKWNPRDLPNAKSFFAN
jgi:uncharacterized membrane protein YphA (DoxX/SURF4 family)